MSSQHDDFTSMFAGLGGFAGGGFNPLMSVNLSGICATTKLLQYLSPSMCDVTRKFDKDPRDAPDCDPDFFRRAKVMIAKVTREINADPELKSMYWFPVLYCYELYKGQGKSQADFGHLVWIDGTLSRFLLVNIYGSPSCECGNAYHNDYDAMIKLQAQRFLNLTCYLSQNLKEPRWIRATYTTDAYPSLPSNFLPFGGTDNLSSAALPGRPPIIHLTPADLVPSLASSDLEKIDIIINRGQAKTPTPENRRRVLVLNSKDAATRPFVPAALPFEVSETIQRDCAGCKQLFDPKDLQRWIEHSTDVPLSSPGSSCKLTYYHSAACQKSHWKTHKIMCKLTRGT
ncbi:hypothetical protein P7C70_g3241, partial [Phenoliferia sp. Uapishka_3]